MNKSFEKHLPDGYNQVFHLSASDVKVGVIFNLVAMIIMVAICLIAAIPVFCAEDMSIDLSVMGVYVCGGAMLLFVYMVLHELVHGIAYKITTGEKLRFGISWSCAFCGVPDIYTYRRTALIALVSPFILFTLILLPLAVLSYFVSVYLYAPVILILATHIGGCAGDLYLTILLLFKYKDRDMLMRDTGPEQFIYLKENKNA